MRNRVQCFVFLAGLLAATTAFGQTYFNTNGCQGGVPCVPSIETTQSAGIFVLEVTNSTVQTYLAGLSLPNCPPAAVGAICYNPTNHVLVSPFLYDSCTAIGVSSSFFDDEVLFPVAVGVAGSSCGVPPPSFTFPAGSVTLPPAPVPAGFPTGQDAIYTDILNLHMTDYLSTNVGIQLNMGAAAPAFVSRANWGEVAADNCAHNIGGSCAATGDFPAYSFFDVFFDIQLPNGWRFHNFNPLTVQSMPATGPLPPSVVYTHVGTGNSVYVYGDPTITTPEAGPVASPLAWQQIGIVFIAGHGVGTMATAAAVHTALCSEPGLTTTLAALLGCPAP